jgi:hypothetical protein
MALSLETLNLINMILTILAIFAAPIVALNIQKRIERLNFDAERKLNIFKTLLATRGNPISLDHVQALNMIDIEFNSQQDVRDAWNSYRDHLSNFPPDSDAMALLIWHNRIQDFLVDLLFSMSQHLDYNLTKVTLRRAYHPRAFGDINSQNETIRRELIAIMNGKHINVKIISDDIK